MWWLVIIIVIILIIIAVTIGVLSNKGNDSDDNIQLNESCNGDRRCAPDLECINGICKIKIGGRCENLTECVPSATECRLGICIEIPPGNLGDICGGADKNECKGDLVCDRGKCRAQVGGFCLDNADCSSDATSCEDNRCISQSQGPGEMCNTVRQCEPGLDCVNGVCMGNEGSSCLQDTDCSSDHICDGGGGSGSDGSGSGDSGGGNGVTRGICVCIPLENEPCSNDGRCGSELMCTTAILKNGYPIYDFLPSAVKDITSYKGQLLLLLEDGNLAIDTGRMLNTVHSDLQMNSIYEVWNNIYGLYQGDLYVKDSNSDNGNGWTWIRQTWYNVNNITWASVTLNGEYFWLQNNRRGYLYGLRHDTIYTVESVTLKSFSRVRVYGRTRSTYLEVDSSKQMAVQHSSMKKHFNLVRAAVNVSGEVDKVTVVDKDKFHSILAIGNDFYKLGSRLCIS